MKNIEEQLNKLLNEAMVTGGVILKSKGKILPYGLIMLDDGKFEHLGIATDSAQKARDAVTALKIEIRESFKSGKSIGAAIGINSRSQNAENGKNYYAIKINIDHKDSAKSLNCFVPYTIEENTKVDFGEIIIQKSDDRLL